MYPFRRVAFQRLNDLARGKLRLGHYQNVDMIIRPADLNGDHVMFPRDAADVCPNTFLDIGCDPFRSTFCGEDDMVKEIRICVRHIQSSLRDEMLTSDLLWVETHG